MQDLAAYPDRLGARSREDENDMVARRRVGVLVPTANSTVEPDFVLAAPKHVTVHANRIGWEATNLTEDEAIVDRMNASVEEAASNLAAARVDVIAYGFATGSFYRGQDYSARLLARLQKATGVPTVAASPAMVEALRVFGARRLTVTSPYPKWNNQRLRAYLEAAGYGEPGDHLGRLSKARREPANRWPRLASREARIAIG